MAVKRKRKPVVKSGKKTASRPPRLRSSLRQATARQAGQAATPVSVPKNRISTGKMREFKELLLKLRERLSGQIKVLRGESLKRNHSVVSEEDGTDAFDRQFALDLASSERDSLLEIDEALRRIEQGDYGVCERCRKLIKKSRLKALPFVKLCIRCKSELESGGTRFRPASALKTL